MPWSFRSPRAPARTRHRLWHDISNHENTRQDRSVSFAIQARIPSWFTSGSHERTRRTPLPVILTTCYKTRRCSARPRTSRLQPEVLFQPLISITITSTGAWSTRTIITATTSIVKERTIPFTVGPPLGSYFPGCFPADVIVVSGRAW